MEIWGTTHSGEKALLLHLQGQGGLSMTVSSYGCRILCLLAPDRAGRIENVVLGYDSLAAYETDDKYAGAAVGRVANLIEGACFEMDGKTYPLSVNDPPQHLHGGIHGFSCVVWEIEKVCENAVTFTHQFPDGLDGYPGTLSVSVSYLLTPDNALEIRWDAMSTKKTPVSFTNHSYFNLDGDFRRDVFGYHLQIHAARMLELSDSCRPTGQILPVENTVFDFRRPRLIGPLSLPELAAAHGYDHSYLPDGSGLRPVACVWSPRSGRRLTVLSDLPVLQLYTSNFAREGLILRDGVLDKAHHAVCLETQYAVDFLHHRGFPARFLLPGETETSTTVYRFDTV